MEIYDYFFTDTQKEIKNLTKKIAQEKILPFVKELDEEEKFPHSIIKELAQADLFRIYIPQEYQGLGLGMVEVCIVIEELSKVCAGVATIYAASILGTIPIIFFGSKEQKEKYLPQIAQGKLCAFALTEPQAGSDASAIRTTATKTSDSYILNGRKQWITNAKEADIYTIVALTAKEKGKRGASCFLVEKGQEGLIFGKKEKKLGIRASTTGEIILDNLKLPKENLLGKEGMGYIITLKTLTKSRPGVGAQAVGIAQAAIEYCLKYSKQRIQFQRPISSFQAIQHILADMATKTEAARALVYTTAMLQDKGIDSDEYSSMSKLFASDVAMEVVTDAVQIFGGYGYMRDYPIEKLFRDAKITQLYEGTNQIQRNIIAQELLKKIE